MAGAGRDMHILAATPGSIYHTIRYANGTFPAGVWGDASSVLGVVHLWDVAAAELNGDLQVCAADTSGTNVVFKLGGRLSSNGNWIALTEQGTRNYNQARAVDCARVGSNFHAVLVDSAGSLFHALRTPDGNWNGFNFLAGPNGGTSSKVAIASSWDGLQVLVISGGSVYHKVRYEAGNWSDWGSISGTSGAQSIDAASVMGDLHVVVGVDKPNQSPSTRVLHTIRYQTDPWSGMGDVTNYVGNGSQTLPVEKAAASGAQL